MRKGISFAIAVALFASTSGVGERVFASPPLERNTGIRFRTSDGVVLTASLHRPEGAGRLPCLLTMTPYGREGEDRSRPDDYVNEERHPDELARRGYAVLVVDARGTGDSGGRWEAVSRREQRDGYELIEWMAHQSWCNGEVGMFGNSALGILTWLVAELRPPHLKAIAVGIAPGDLYRDVVYPGGILGLEDVALLIARFYGQIRKEPCTRPETPEERADLCPGRLANSIPDLLVQAVTHPFDDALWEERNIERRVSRITAPTLIWDGWADLFIRGALWNFAGLRAPKRLVVGPWAHEDPDPGLTSWRVTYSTSDDRARWFDRWLKGRLNETESDPRVRYYVVNGGWRSATDWPIPKAKRRGYFLGEGPSDSARSLNDGSLVPARGANGNGVDVLPLAPAGTTSGHYFVRSNFRPHSEPQDQRPDEVRELTYTTRQLERPLDVVGPIELRLWATASGPDFGIVARITDVAPDGTSSLVTSGWLRASHRALDRARTGPLMPYHPHTVDSARDVAVGEPVLYRIEIWPTAWRFRSGHRLRLDVAATDLPHQAPAAGSPVVLVLRDRAHASALLVPVLGRQHH